MPWTRRDFLRSLGATTAGIALSPLSAIRLEENSYTNTRLGFGLEKPEGWEFCSVVDFVEHVSNIEQPAREKYVTESLLVHGEDPILVANKYPLEHEGLTPTMQVYAEPPLQEGTNFVEHMRGSIQNLHQFLPECRIRKPLERYEQFYHETLQFEADYLYRAGGQEFEVRLHSLICHTREYFLVINMVGTRSGADSILDEFASVRQSLWFS